MCETKEQKKADIIEKLVGNDPAELQSVIDVDKYTRSMECGYDLCGAYAPFCAGCDKSISYPCAQAYLKSLAPKTEQPKKTTKRKTRIAVARKK